MNSFLKSLVPLPLLLLLAALRFPSALAATFTIQNHCLYTVWAAAIPGGGRRLDRGQTWILNLPTGGNGRIWGRTGCDFDESGRGNCRSGDCNGLLECDAYGEAPVTTAEFSLTNSAQLENWDYYDLSLVDGFNVPMEFGPVSVGCTRGIKCTADINDECPSELRAAGGCYNPCTVFRTDEYCCNGGDCKLTNYSKFFKDRCPDAYGYPRDEDSLSTFTCPSGTNYEVVFCPENSSLDRTTPFLLVCN